MPNVVVVGAQWGDEGKGKITDILAAGAKGVVRSQGGANAGHTIVFGGKEFRLHLVPSGVFFPNATCYIAAGVVLDLESIVKEIKQVRDSGIEIKNRLWISARAHVVLPHHKYMDVWQEKLKGASGIGTTKKGIGPCYGDKIHRIGLRLAEIADPSRVNQHLNTTWQLIEKLYPFLEGHEKQWRSECEQLIEYASQIKPFIKEDFEYTLDLAAKQGNLIFEGAQGTLLDITFGSYPFVTSSSTSSTGIINGAGIAGRYVDHVLGVMKAYTTRVGSGILPSAMSDEEQQFFDHHAVREIGTTTGRKRRIGWFDGVIGRYSVMINGIDSMAITKLDVLDDLKTIKVLVGYKIGTKVLEYPPICAEDWDQIEPIYNELPGWQSPTKDCREHKDLPENARRYIEWIEEWCKVPASIVSVGPGRDQTIIRNKLL